jgi:zinc/manganese transport system substrate-binding protein
MNLGLIIQSFEAWRKSGRYPFALILSLVSLACCLSCAVPASSPVPTPGVIQVVAAENFWGSIAAQLGGIHANVISIISNPNVDPHEYESSTADARAFVQANYVILNGAGYDTWGQKLLDANPVSGRKVLIIADLLGKKPGDNPHFWYDPDYVSQVIDQITKDYQSIDPGDLQYFSDQKSTFENALTPYHQIIASIKQTYSGVKVGSTESVFVYMANALGLDLISPAEFMIAVSEGNDPPVSAMVEFQQQIMQKQIALLVYNIQTVTTITTNIEQLAASYGIPTVGVSETVDPADAKFQDWQVRQLQSIQSALSSSH